VRDRWTTHPDVHAREHPVVRPARPTLRESIIVRCSQGAPGDGLSDLQLTMINSAGLRRGQALFSLARCSSVSWTWVAAAESWMLRGLLAPGMGMTTSAWARCQASVTW
jgi:hypothetical protein